MGALYFVCGMKLVSYKIVKSYLLLISLPFYFLFLQPAEFDWSSKLQGRMFVMSPLILLSALSWSFLFNCLTGKRSVDVTRGLFWLCFSIPRLTKKGMDKYAKKIPSNFKIQELQIKLPCLERPTY